MYKFNKKGENEVQPISVTTNSEIILGITRGGDADATITLVDDDTSAEITNVITDSTGIVPNYKMYRIDTPAERTIKNYTATVSGVDDQEEPYSFTIKIRVVINGVSYGALN